MDAPPPLEVIRLNDLMKNFVLWAVIAVAVLVLFSQFTMMMDILEDYLAQAGYE